MRTEERYFYVTEGKGFKKGDVIERHLNQDFNLIEEDSEIELFGVILMPAKRYLKNDPKVTLIEVSCDIRESAEDDTNIDEITLFRVIETDIHYENAIELVSDFEELSVLASL